MPRGRLVPPNLDDRNWQDLVNEATKLIEKYTKDWTDHNPSDLGITLIELFAWIAEQIIYRLNRVPDKHFIEFLNLIGVTQDPPTPAQVDITFKIAGDEVVTIPKGTQVSTPPSGTEEGVIFETDEDLHAVNLKRCIVLVDTHATQVKTYTDYTAMILEKPYETIDVTIPPNETRILLLGTAVSTESPLSLTFKIPRFKFTPQSLKGLQEDLEEDKVEPKNAEKTFEDLSRLVDQEFSTEDTLLEAVKKSIGQEKTDKYTALILRYARPRLVSPEWLYSKTGTPPDEWPSVTPVTNASYAFDKSGRVGIKIPADWTEQSPDNWEEVTDGKVTESLFWIGVRFRNTNEHDITVHFNRIAANMTTATNALTVENEELGTSNGKPFQVFQLKNTPLYQDTKAGDPLGHLNIAVNEESWTKVEDFSQGNMPEYMCNPVTGEISFGNYPTVDPDDPVKPPRGYGRIPDEGSQIKAVSYRYVVGGSNGNVPKETINVPRVSNDQRVLVPEINGVINEEGASGGTDWEKLEDTKRRGPEILKVQDRAVTVEDYEYLARRATTDVAKVRCFPPKRGTSDPWVMKPFKRTPGKVNIIIVPNERVARKPTPSDTLIQEVKAYLDERRTITSIMARPYPPYYVEIRVSATVYVQAKQNVDSVKRKIQDELFKFFHPIVGGPKGLGWEIGQDLYMPDVFAVIQSIPAVSYIQELKIGQDGNGLVSVVRLGIKDYELICASELNDINYAIDVKEEKLES